MADDADRAADLEQARILNSLTAIKREITTVNTEIECIECGDEIEEERRRLMPSAKRCFVCQELHERPRRVKRL